LSIITLMTDSAPPNTLFLSDVLEYANVCKETVRRYRLLGEFPPPAGRIKRGGLKPDKPFGYFWHRQDIDDWLKVWHTTKQYDVKRDYRPVAVESAPEVTLSDAIMEALGEADSDSDH